MRLSNARIAYELRDRRRKAYFCDYPVLIPVFDPGTAVATGDGKAMYRVPSVYDGMDLIGVAAAHYTASAAGGNATTDIQIRNTTDSVDMLSTKLTIDREELDSSTASTATEIDTDKDDISTGDLLAIDLDQVAGGTAPEGLVVELQFCHPKE